MRKEEWGDNEEPSCQGEGGEDHMASSSGQTMG